MKRLADSERTPTDSILGETASPFLCNSGVWNVYDQVGDSSRPASKLGAFHRARSCKSSKVLLEDGRHQGICRRNGWVLDPPCNSYDWLSSTIVLNPSYRFSWIRQHWSSTYFKQAETTVRNLVSIFYLPGISIFPRSHLTVKRISKSFTAGCREIPAW